MKIIFLIAFLLIFSLASSKVTELKRQLVRTVAPEDLALEIEFYGNCREFRDKVLPSVTINVRHECLPIQIGVAENPDNNDLNSHVFCTNTYRGKSVVHFVEIFSSNDASAVSDFVVSFVPTTPFRVLTEKVSLARRPDCHITNDYCNATNAVVDSCRTNEIVHRRHNNGRNNYVVSNDRIYVTSNQLQSADCKTSAAACCGHVAPLSFGGICNHEASRDLLEFPKRQEHDNGYGRPEEHHNERPQEHHNDEYGRPDEHRERPNEHHNDEYGRPQEHHNERPNEHHNNEHGRPNEHHNDGYGRPEHHEEEYGRPQEHHNERPNEHHNDEYGRPEHHEEEYGRPQEHHNDEYGRPEHHEEEYGRPQEHHNDEYGRPEHHENYDDEEEEEHRPPQGPPGVPGHPQGPPVHPQGPPGHGPAGHGPAGHKKEENDEEKK